MTASQPTHSRFSRSLQVPPLENGDCLTRIEFERRYNAMPSLQSGDYMTLLAEDGVIRSRVFPGLRLDVVAMLDGNMPQVLPVLQSSINSAEHQAFVQRWADAQSRKD